MVEHHEVDLPAELGLELHAKIEPEGFVRAALGRRLEQYRHVEIAAWPRFAARDAAEQVDRGHAPFPVREGSPKPLD